jgi:membrane-bound serine protease (ClpP class)
MLFDSDVPGVAVSRPLIATLSVASLLFVLGMALLAARTRKRPLVSGVHTLVGAIGEVVSVEGDGGPEGWAQVRGEHWRVRGTKPLHRGERVRVTRAEGLTLEVEGA